MTAPASNTPYAIINDAMHDAGYLMQGQTANGEQLAKYMRQLEDMINFRQTKGLKLFLNVDTQVTLVVGQALYSFGPAGTVQMTKPLRIVEGYYIDSNGVRRPLIPLAWNDWIKLGQVNQLGPVTQYLVDKQPAVLNVTLWLIPDATAATGSVHFLFQIQVTNPISLTETMQFPIEWRMALRWGLADDISTGQPAAVVANCAAKAAFYWDALENWDVEDAPTQFQPDSRSQYVTRRFQ
jgi:hypothetical protein